MTISNKYKPASKGFTLIEAVVSAAIFVFVIGAILGVYNSALKLDSRSRAQRNVIDNGRFLMEFFDKEITNGHIVYDPVACAHNYALTDNLCLVNQNGEAESFTWDVDLSNPGNPKILTIHKSQGSSALVSKSVNVTKLQFIVTPTTDSLVAAARASGPNEQPHVTVILELTNNSTRDPVKLNFQSTFTELYYPARQ